MKFEVFPILDIMINFYHKPIGGDRFGDYLNILKGDSNSEMKIPIPNFNPMGKAHVLDKLQELKELQAEKLMQEVLDEMSKEFSTKKGNDIQVVISLADDLKGGWTNLYTTDYDSKFKTNAYLNRDFCIPVFWTSEQYDTNTIKRRIEQYCFRTIYQKENGIPETLEEHIKQELFLNKNAIENNTHSQLLQFSHIDEYFHKYKKSIEYSRIFNFMYGDDICQKLGYATFGIMEQMAGYKYASMLDS